MYVIAVNHLCVEIKLYRNNNTSDTAVSIPQKKVGKNSVVHFMTCNIKYLNIYDSAFVCSLSNWYKTQAKTFLRYDINHCISFVDN